MARKAKQPTEPIVRTLQWIPSKGRRCSYDLRAGDRTIGCVSWPKLFGSLAEGAFAEERWTFKRGGFLRPRVTARPQGSVADSAVLELSFSGGGGLKTKSGRHFQLHRQGFWSKRYGIKDERGTENYILEPKF